MKCNKCLKIIPKGEEIRFSAHDSSWRGDGGGYGGCYCETCWKESKYYKYREDGGKPPKGSGSSSIPWWVWMIVIFLVALIMVLFAFWMTKEKKDDD